MNQEHGRVADGTGDRLLLDVDRVVEILTDFRRRAAGRLPPQNVLGIGNATLASLDS
jgi:hypothetical protein